LQKKTISQREIAGFTGIDYFFFKESIGRRTGDQRCEMVFFLQRPGSSRQKGGICRDLFQILENVAALRLRSGLQHNLARIVGIDRSMTGSWINSVAVPVSTLYS